MTDFEMALTVMSCVVAGASLFGAFWIKVERRQSQSERGADAAMRTMAAVAAALTAIQKNEKARFGDATTVGASVIGSKP